MPFAEHRTSVKQTVATIVADRGKRRVVKQAKPGPKPTGVAAVMGQIGKELTPAERKVLSAPVPPPWHREHVVDPEWVVVYEKSHQRPIAEKDPFEYIFQTVKSSMHEMFPKTLFDLDAPRKPGAEPSYKLTNIDFRDVVRDFMHRIIEEAGVALPEADDDRDEAFDAVEDRLRTDLNAFIGKVADAAVEALRYAIDEEVGHYDVLRGLWVNYIEGGLNCEVEDAVSGYDLCMTGFSILTDPEIDAVLSDLRMQRLAL